MGSDLGMSTLQFEIEKFQSEDLKNNMGNYWMRVADQIHLINRFVFLEWASARIIAGWVPAAPELEWKCDMTRMMWHNMTIAERLRTRKEELSSNSKILIPSEALQTFIQETSQADSYISFTAGWFLEFNKSLVDAYESFLTALDPIFDAPTLELIEEFLPRKRQQTAWAQKIIHHAVKDPIVLQKVDIYRDYVRTYLQSMGGIDGRFQPITGQSPIMKPTNPVTEPFGPAPKKRAKPNNVLTMDAFDPPVEVANNLKIFMWHYMTEIQVVDPMCYIFFGVGDMPFEFYCDFSRHIWDETRHHRMGVRRLQQMGFDTAQFPIPYGEDAISELEQYYAELTMIGETCSFSRKKKSMEAFYAQGDILSGMTAEIDIVDERSHVRYGKKWIPILYQKSTGDPRNLDEIVRDMMNRWMGEDTTGLGKQQVKPELALLSESERKSITHFAFCGKIEFKDLNFDRL